MLTFSQNDFEWTILEKIAVYTNGKGHENNVNEKGKYILINSKFVSTKGEVIKLLMNNLVLFIKMSLLWC